MKFETYNQVCDYRASRPDQCIVCSKPSVGPRFECIEHYEEWQAFRPEKWVKEISKKCVKEREPFVNLALYTQWVNLHWDECIYPSRPSAEEIYEYLSNG